MILEKLYAERKSAILNRWFELTVETYPEETARFLKSKKNRFANPVGYTLYKEIEPIVEWLFQGSDLETIRPGLENIIRIRAVQDLSAAQAVAFVFTLKQAVREELEEEIRENRVGRELLELESRIDTLALFSFDIFMGCREKIYDLKAQELQKRTVRLLKRAKLVVEDQAET
jgi:hypothetical protein